MTRNLHEHMPRRELLALQVLLMGLVVEIGDSRFRFDADYELCVECSHFDGEDKTWKSWLKTECSLQYFIEICSKMTNEQFWGLVGDVGLNKIDAKAL